MPPLAAHRSGKSATISALSVGPTHLHLCAFAFAFTFCGRLPAIPYKRLSFFLGGQRDNRTTGQRRRQRRICFYYFRRAESVCCFVCLQLPQSPGLARSPFFVLLREFITFRVLRLLSGSAVPSPSLLSFLLFFFVAVHLIFKRNLLLPGATVSPCPLCPSSCSCRCWLVQPGILWSISKMTWTKHWRQLWSVFGWQLQRAVNFFCVLCPLALITFLP